MKVILGRWGSASLNATATSHISRDGEWVDGVLKAVGDAAVTLTIDGVNQTFDTEGDDKLALAVEEGVVRLGRRVRVCIGYGVVAVEAEPLAADTEDDTQNEVWVRLTHGAVWGRDR